MKIVKYIKEAVGKAKSGKYVAEQGLPALKYEDDEHYEEPENEPAKQGEITQVDFYTENDIIEVKKELKNEYKNLIGSIRKFRTKYVHLAVKLDSIMLQFKEPKIVETENLDSAFAERQAEIDEVCEHALNVEIVFQNYKIAKRKADAMNVKIAQIVPAETIKLDIDALHNAKQGVGIAKQKVRRIIDDNSLHQNSTAIRSLISLNGGTIKQDNGTTVNVSGYANDVMETIGNVVEILQKAGV